MHECDSTSRISVPMLHCIDGAYVRRSVVADEVVGVAHSGNGAALRQTAADFLRRAPDNLHDADSQLTARLARLRVTLDAHQTVHIGDNFLGQSLWLCTKN